MADLITTPAEAAGLLDGLLCSSPKEQEAEPFATLAALQARMAALPSLATPEAAALAREILHVVLASSGKDGRSRPIAWSVWGPARLVFATSTPGAAFAELAPRLDDPAGVASEVLRAVEETLDAASLDAVAPLSPPIDERWAEPVAALARRPDEVGMQARTVLRALTWFAGQPMPAPTGVDLGEGDDPPFPFMVLGWREDCAAIKLDDRPVDLIHAFDHQYGGYSCLHARLVGLPLALPEWSALEVAELASIWWESWGNDMTEPDLNEWAAALGGMVALESGAEALLCSAPLADLNAFHGRTVLRFRPRRAPWRPTLDFSAWSPNPHVEDEGPFGSPHAAALDSLSLARGIGPVRAFILWGNSD